MGAGPEKRTSIRISERCRVAYRMLPIDGETSKPTTKQAAAQTLNLSASGLCILSDAPLAPERFVALELKLSDREDPVVAVGRVVWCDRDNDRFRVGICYTWLREGDRQDLGIIADYVARRIEPTDSDVPA